MQKLSEAPDRKRGMHAQRRNPFGKRKKPVLFQ